MQPQFRLMTRAHAWRAGVWFFAFLNRVRYRDEVLTNAWQASCTTARRRTGLWSGPVVRYTLGRFPRNAITNSEVGFSRWAELFSRQHPGYITCRELLLQGQLHTHIAGQKSKPKFFTAVSLRTAKPWLASGVTRC